MSKKVTTTGYLRVEDVTFKHARRQSDMLKELADRNGIEENNEPEVEVPVSLTPEQVKNYYTSKIKDSKDTSEKRLYQQTIRWIDELSDVKRKLLSIEAKLAKMDTKEDYDNGEI